MANKQPKRRSREARDLASPQYRKRVIRDKRSDKPKHANRESWLQEATRQLDRVVFKPTGQVMPKDWRVTCGWPSVRAMSAKKTRIGECWDKAASSDKHVEIIISMKVDQAVPVLDILAHEMVHGVVGCKCGHKGPFAKLARQIGLSGKLTATIAGPELNGKLHDVAKVLGPYPHGRINAAAIDRKKQTTRLVKCLCNKCGYVVRTTRHWIDAKGAPLCPCNSEQMEVA